MSTRSTKPAFPEKLLGREDVGEEDVAARSARDAGELEDPADAHAARHASGRSTRARRPAPSPWRAAKGAVTRTEPRVASSAREEPVSAGAIDEAHVAHGLVAAPVDAQDLDDVARRLARAGDDRRCPSRPARRTPSPRGRRGARGPRSARRRPGPRTTKSLRPETVEAASRNDSVTLRLA